MINIIQYENQLKQLVTKVNLKELFGKKILITGASGLIGSTIIDLLVYLNRTQSANIHIIGLSRSLDKLEKRFSYKKPTDQLTFIAQDISELVPMSEAFDYIVHAASNADPINYALYPAETITTNVMGTTNLLNYMKSCPQSKMVFLSTIEVYGTQNSSQPLREDEYEKIDFNQLRSGYPESKRVSELLCRSYVHQYGIHCVITRLGYIYGPTMALQDSKAVAQFIRNAVNKENIVLKSKGEQIRSYCYVLDAVTGILAVLLKGKAGEAYNIADDHSVISIKQLAELISSLVGTELSFDLPNQLEAKGFSKPHDAILNTEKIKELGWDAYTDIKSGLSNTIDVLSRQRFKS